MKRVSIILAVALVAAALLGLPLLWRGGAAAGGDMPTLVVITPHNEQIRYEVGRAFSRWHEQQFGEPVAIDWRAIGGTSDIERQLLSQYAALAERGNLDQGVGYDVVFGGGDYFFDRRLKPGVDGEPILKPLDLEPELIRQVYGTSSELAGKKLYDAEGTWWGVVLSSFGIVYNPQVLALRGVPEPTTWADLTNDRLIGWLAMADPSHSGSVRVTYEAIVQWSGFEDGWATLRRMGANARYFSNSATKVPLDVSAGEAAAGIAIDFYGRYQAEIVGDDRLRYIAPAKATVVTADPVAVLRGTRQPVLAKRFVRFLLSVDGQAMWNLPVGHELGPERFALRRPPIRRDLYTPAWLGQMIDPVNPYELAEPLPPGTPSWFSVMPTVLHAMAMDVHDELREAWRTIQATADPDLRRRMVDLFDALPFTEQELIAAPGRWRDDPNAQHADRLAWTRFFRRHYEQIVELGR